MDDVKRLCLTPASQSDAGEIASLYLASRSDALPYLRRVHTDTEVRAWIRDVVLKRGETWVARKHKIIVGFLTLIGDEIEQLYVLPGHYRCGIGGRLLEAARKKSPNRLYLYTFQRNAGARAFYEGQGLRIVDMNDGSRNEEREPDIRYEWTPSGALLRPQVPLDQA